MEKSASLPHHSVMSVGLQALPQRKQYGFGDSNACSYFVIAPMSNMFEYGFLGGGRDSPAREHMPLLAASPGKGTGNDRGYLWLRKGMLAGPGRRAADAGQGWEKAASPQPSTSQQG